jgi:diguanylate cyclase (GGDEF)-like protein
MNAQLIEPLPAATSAITPTRTRSRPCGRFPIRKLEPIGAIGNYWARRHQPSDHEVSLLQALADSTSIAIEHVRVYSELEQRVRDRTADLENANEEIRQLSVTDELTKLNNRRGFYLLAEPALDAARRRGGNFLLAFLDVDGLKRVNDEHGHDVGDMLIADVARALRATLRESDILARMGGDEFCVLLTEAADDPAMLRKRLLEAFRCVNDASTRPYRLSAGIGIVGGPASDATSVDELLARADELMYQEKKATPGARLRH